MSQPTAITAYAAAKIVNAALEEAGLDKRIPAQMVYNYTTARVRAEKTPLIPIVKGTDGQVLVSVKGLTEWLQKYIAKNMPTTTSEVDLVKHDTK